MCKKDDKNLKKLKKLPIPHGERLILIRYYNKYRAQQLSPKVALFYVEQKYQKANGRKLVYET